MTIEARGSIDSKSWNELFDEQINHLTERSEYTLQEVADVVLRTGILEHISPTDTIEYQSRIDRDKPVFKRDDPELYDFLLQDITHLRRSINATLIGGYSAEIIKAWTAISLAKTKPKDFKPGIAGAEQIIEIVEDNLKEIREGLKKNGGSVVAVNESEASSSEE